MMEENQIQEQFELVNDCNSNLRLANLAMQRVMDSMKLSKEELEEKVSELLQTQSVSSVKRANTPHGDSTRTNSLTEIHKVAKAAAGISKMISPPSASLSSMTITNVANSIGADSDLDSEENLINKKSSEKMICTARPPRSRPGPTLYSRNLRNTGIMSEQVFKNMVGTRDYLLMALQGNNNFLPVTHETSQVIESVSENIEEVIPSILNFVGNGEILDLRSQNASRSRIRTLSSMTSNNNYGEKPIDYSLFLPPNEFDWLCKEEMGQIFSSPAACHLFTTLRHSSSAQDLEELYFNGCRTEHVEDAAQDEAAIQFHSIAETLADLPKIKKLILRGICDNTMLKCIGQSMNQLEYLDISGSFLVTSEGIQSLIFKNPVFNSAFYLIPTWIAKNYDKMNPLVNTITYLDHSWTSVSSMGRKIIQLLPGNYLFRRLMHFPEQDPVAHHIFIRNEPTFQTGIAPFLKESAAEMTKKMGTLVGIKGLKHFRTLVENHPWKRCHLAIYHTTDGKKQSIPELGNFENFETLKARSSASSKKVHFGIITPNQHEKRVQGIVHWDSQGNLTELYTIYPLNLNILSSLNNIKLYRGILYDTCRMQFSILPELTTLDIFTEPRTLISILQFCPNLRIIHVRIRTTSLTDDQFAKAIQNSMSRRSIEEFWIAPGSNSDSTTPTTSTISSSTSFNLTTEPSMESMTISAVTSTSDLGKKLSSSDFISSELIQLTLESLDVIIEVCPKLKRVGDLAIWVNVDEVKFFAYCEELRKRNNRVTVTWGNMDFPFTN